MQSALGSFAPRRLHALLLCAAAIAAGPFGCGSERTVHGEPDTATCSRCHGSADNAAPPRSTRGGTDASDPAVGAHQIHLRGSALRTPLACADCHVVPEGANAASHVDGKVTVTFGALARADGASPTWSGDTLSCSATYCHGGTIAGGALTAPVWNRGAAEAACGACHGLPPPAPHVQNPDCGRCHLGYTATSVVAATHVDGKVDVKRLECNGCHGSATSVAPPIGTAGETETTQVAVGAHQQHLRDGAIRKRLMCADCHVLPFETLHADGKVDLTWGGLASAGGASPSFDPASATCASTYCHGATLTLGGGGALTTPVWTAVGKGQTACGACHAAPPGLPHPQRFDCSRCHPGTTTAGDTAIDVAGGQHVDGKLDLAPVTCTMCHGTEGVNPAPPAGTRGETLTSELAVGAHQKHVVTGSIRAALDCDECHVKPSVMLHADGTVQIAWGALAANRTTPEWTRASATCSSTYCHGATLSLGGGNARAPVWTAVSDGPTACDSCHGFAPPLPHPQNTNCRRCHEGTVLADGTIDLAGGRHIDGKLDVSAGACTACHGTEGVNPAPPIGTRGETLTTQRAVGAHQKHVLQGTIRGALACADCHEPITSLLHVDGTIPLPFTGLGSQGTTPVWNGATCSSTYCHGATLAAGGSNTAPTWTAVSGGPTACGSCHGAPPPLPHPQSADCARCHSSTVRADGTIDLVGGKHLDGTLQVDGGGCTACHGTEGVNPAPPVGTGGETQTSAIAVGAHQKHVRDGAIRKAFDCAQCHVSPAVALHANGVVDLAWGALAARGTSPQWTRATATCSSTYCHGATLPIGGGTSEAPVWTAVTAGPTPCDSCHGFAPPLPHPQNTDCRRCHAGTVLADGTIDVAGGLHLDGTVEVSGGGCTGCHGTEGVNPAPPVGTRGETLTTQRAVGAHQKHVVTGTIRNAFACSDCHATVSDLTHVNGTISLPFTGLASSGTTPVWNGTTCASSYCHGATLGAGGSNTAPTWTAVSAGPTACSSCHGAPPPFPHPQSADCARCHSGTVRADGTIDLAGGKHLDGTLQVDGGGCTACHGTEGVNPAPPVGTRGETLVAQRAVGAHQKHVVGGSIRNAFACSDCHAPVTDLTHANGTVSLPFAGLASSGTTPVWNGTTCSSTYCHGATLDVGGVAKTPTWTVVSAGPTACNSCHGAPPPLPHPQNADCNRCHEGTVLPGGGIDLAGGKHLDGTVQVDGGGCTACHGTEGVNPAPPVGTRGETLTSERAVGAHQKHVVTGAIRNALACSDCHAPVSGLAHVNGVISLPFDGLASTGTTPSWTGTTCASTYCHGATLAAGGSNTAPTWTAVTAGSTPCGSCHGAPPPFPHPPSTDCARCHSGTVLADGTIDLVGGKHLDGTLQVDGGGCTACHGTEGVNPAPPVGTRGETLTTQRAVGAHQKHVVTGTIRNAFACSDCHAPVADLTHVNGTISLPFTGLASRGTTPSWTGTTCASTYCHGATLAAGGSTTTPTWTAVTAGPTPCNSCHGAPPSLPHPQNGDCHRCHEGTVLASGAIDLAGGQHLDGTVQVSAGGCTACHGTDGVNPAPPLGTAGETLTTQRAVGAHQKHVVDGPIREALACDACHATVSDLTHVNGTISMPFAGLASQGTTPSWNGAACSSTYCHGATLAAGGAATAPVWTSVSAGATGCTGCHGFPPPAPHPPNPLCNSCHPLTVGIDGKIDVAGGRHVDGTLDVAGLTCRSCHGSTENPAPPIGTRGETATTALAVGAHQRHVKDGPIRNALSCADCHVVPTQLLHGDGKVDLAWGALATQLGAAPVWDRAQATCASTYCHGAKLSGGAEKTPTWTALPPGQTPCGSCHGAPPPPPHPASALTGCARCHPDTVNPDGSIKLAGARHIDGTLDVSGKCGDCHPVPGTSGAHLVHAAFPTPSDPQAPSDPAYGDLRVLEDYAPGGGLSYRFGCGNCHPIDPSKHMDFVVQVELSPTGAGALRARNAPNAAYDQTTGRCSGVYCHSSGQQAPAFALVPAWTSGEDLGCDGCHGNPPKYPSAGAGAPVANSHIGLTDQGREFGHYVGLGGPSHASKHGGAGEDAAPITCQTCHYATTDPTSTGPSGFYWLDTTGSYVLEGGDPARLTDARWRNTQCVTCHATNGAPTGAGRVMPLRHVNGRRDVVFDPRAALPPIAGLPPSPDTPTRPYWVTPSKFCEAIPAGAVIEGTTLSLELSGAAYDPATKRCSNVGCHLDDAPVWGRPYLTRPSSTSVSSCCRCHGSRCSSP